jgi:hypothetical protein
MYVYVCICKCICGLCAEICSIGPAKVGVETSRSGDGFFSLGTPAGCQLHWGPAFDFIELVRCTKLRSLQSRTERNRKWPVRCLFCTREHHPCRVLAVELLPGSHCWLYRKSQHKGLRGIASHRSPTQAESRYETIHRSHRVR